MPLRLLTFIWLLAVLTACQEPVSFSIFPEGLELRPGDVVFRRGNGLVSNAVRMADSHNIYTHTGIVADSCGVLMIVHAVPGEPDFDGDPDRVKMEKPETFFLSDRAEAGEVRRHHDAAIAALAAKAAAEAYSRGTLFDNSYDYRDTVQLYCTELIVYAFQRAGQPLDVKPSPSPFSLSLIKADSIFMPSDILQSKLLATISKF